MAVAYTAADVMLVAPEFCNVPVATIDRYIDIARQQINEECFGVLSKYAGILLVAHMMSVAGVTSATSAGGGAAGPVTQMSVGDVSVSYGSGGFAAGMSASVSSSLGLSKYGQEFARLVRMGGFFAAVL